MKNKLVINWFCYIAKTRAFAWRNIFKGEPGNIPFWVGLWPWPVAAEAYRILTGNYPDWTPDL